MNIPIPGASRAATLALAMALGACAAPSAPIARSAAAPAQLAPALNPQPNLESWAAWWMPRHQAKLAEVARSKAEHRDIALVFVGDSITHGWEQGGAAVWNSHYSRYNALDLGFSGDRTEHVLWRLQQGEVDGLHPKVVVLLIGTNNSGHRKEDPAATAAGVKRIVEELGARMPAAKILVLGVFPRADMPGTPVSKIVEDIDTLLPALADGRRVFYLDINKVWLDADGKVSKALMPDLLHPNEQGYAVWAQAMDAQLQQLMR